MSEKKAFKFYRSYYEVAKELPEGEREKYLMAVLEKQFEDKEPELDGMARFAYISQKHSIERQCKGYNDSKLSDTPGEGPYQGPQAPPQGGPPEGGGLGPPEGPRQEGIRNKEKGERTKGKGQRQKTIKARKETFRDTVKGFADKYPREMLKEFYEYWTEKNQAGVKMRFEKEPTFEISKRLARWASNQKIRKADTNQKTDKSYERLD